MNGIEGTIAGYEAKLTGGKREEFAEHLLWINSCFLLVSYLLSCYPLLLCSSLAITYTEDILACLLLACCLELRFMATYVKILMKNTKLLRQKSNQFISTIRRPE